MPDKITEVAKFLIDHAWAVFVFSFFILLSPVAWGGPLVSQIRPYAWIAFAASSVVVLGQVVKVGYGWGNDKLEKRQTMARLQKRLHQLTSKEQDTLRPYIHERTRTRSLYPDDGVVAGLQHEHVIYPVVPFVREGLRCDFNMQPWAYTYLTEHPDLVGLDAPHIDTSLSA